MAEISLNFHQYFLNHLFQFVGSLQQLLPDELVNEFMTKSSIWANYNKLWQSMDMTNQEEIYQDGRESMKRQEQIEARLSQTGADANNATFNNQLSQKTYRSKDSKVYKFKSKEEVCPFIRTDPIQYSQTQGFVQNKILIQEIDIKALRVYLTFRVHKIDTSKGTEGFFTAFVNFFSSFANVSEAQIYFSQIEIENAYSTLDDLRSRLTKHYVNQGINQVYQIFGATDIIGNPVGLINNLGRGVEELYSEPFQGVLKGDVKQTAIGFGKGLKSLAANTAIGVSNSVSRISGTLYLTLKNLSGKQMSESNLDNPRSIQSGLYHGTKGMAVELGQGIIGIVSTPAQNVRDQGTGCIQITKGTFQGFFGMAISPLVSSLKLIHSVTTGVKNFAQGGENLTNKRFRYPRYLDDKEVMKSYDTTYSHAYTALHLIKNGIYKMENILNAFDVSDYLDLKKKTGFKERIIICTEERVLYVQNLHTVKAMYTLKQMSRVQIIREMGKDAKLGEGNALSITLKNGKRYVWSTGRPEQNKEFVECISHKLQRILLSKRLQ